MQNSQSLLPDTPGGGLPSKLAVQQALDIQSAASATPADPSAVSSQLTRTSFVGGYSKVWESGTDYVTMIALEFSQPADADAFVVFQRGALVTAANTYVTDHTEIPGSFVYVISSVTRKGNNDVICEGVWFAFATHSFETMTCGLTPAFATQAEDLAMREYQTARALLSSPKS